MQLSHHEKGKGKKGPLCCTEKSGKKASKGRREKAPLSYRPWLTLLESIYPPPGNQKEGSRQFPRSFYCLLPGSGEVTADQKTGKEKVFSLVEVYQQPLLLRNTAEISPEKAPNFLWENCRMRGGPWKKSGTILSQTGKCNSAYPEWLRSALLTHFFLNWGQQSRYQIFFPCRMILFNFLFLHCVWESTAWHETKKRKGFSLFTTYVGIASSLELCHRVVWRKKNAEKWKHKMSSSIDV